MSFSFGWPVCDAAGLMKNFAAAPGPVNSDLPGCCLQNENGGRISKRAGVALSKERFACCPWPTAAGIPAAAIRSALQAGGKPERAKRSLGIVLNP